MATTKKKGASAPAARDVPVVNNVSLSCQIANLEDITFDDAYIQAHPEVSNMGIASGNTLKAGFSSVGHMFSFDGPNLDGICPALQSETDINAAFPVLAQAVGDLGFPNASFIGNLQPDSTTVTEALQTLDSGVFDAYGDALNIFGTYIQSGDDLATNVLALDTALGTLDTYVHDLSVLVGSQLPDGGPYFGPTSVCNALEQVGNWVGTPVALSSVDVVDAKNVYTSLSGLDAAIMSLQTDSAIAISSVAGSGNVARTYTVSQGGQTVGTIDIPKDFLVKSSAISTVTTADVPYSGAVPGDKYIDFVINTREGTEQAEHIYLPVNDLVDVYTAQQNATQIQLDINDQNVISARVVAGSIGTTELSNLAVTTAKIADDAITSAKILSGAVVTDKIADSAVTTTKIANANVTTAKIADRAVTTDKIALVDGATNHIWTLSVYNGRLFGVDTGVVAS